MDIEMHYSFDFTQQVHLPHNPFQPGPMYFMVPRKCGIFGVCCEALPQQINYLIDEGQSTGKGSNMVISLLHHFLENFGKGEKRLSLHCDNCSGQNKNRYMLDYLARRVATGRHREIALHFMPVGHTKFAPDWCFGLLKQTFRRTEVNCLKEMVGAVEASTQKGIDRAQLVGLEDGTPLVAIHDWQTFFAEYRAVAGIKSLFHFYFDAGDPGVVRHAAGLNQETGSTRLAQDIVQNGMPAVIPAPGLPLARREYLYNNIRQFVTEDWKDTMCPSV